MFIQTETTENPARMRFLQGQTVLSTGTAGFLDKEASARSPLAQRLFEIEGIISVYLDPQAITLTKADDIEWPMLKPVILGAIMEHFTAGEPIILDQDQPLPRPGLDTPEDFRRHAGPTCRVLKSSGVSGRRRLGRWAKESKCQSTSPRKTRGSYPI